MKKLIFMAAMILCVNLRVAYSAVVEIPSTLLRPYQEGETAAETTTMFPQGFRPIISGQAEYVETRKLRGTDAGARGQFYTIKVSLPVYLLGLWDWYGEFGITNGIRYKAILNGRFVRFRLNNDTLVWSAGANWAPLQFPDYAGLAIFTDVKYRRIFNADEYDSVTVNDVKYKSFDSSKDAGWREWQLALGMALRSVEGIVPYGGIKYSDVKQKANVTISGVNYNLGERKSRHKVGGFAGVSAVIPNTGNALSFDVQVRFIDEMAYSGKVTWKF